MNFALIPIFSLLFASTALASSLESLYKEAEQLSVDLAKFPEQQSADLTGKHLSDFINRTNLKKIILIKAETAAPAELDILNVLKSLSEDYIFDPTNNDPQSNTIREAVLVTNDDQYFLLEFSKKDIHLTTKEWRARFTREKKAQQGAAANP